MVSYKRAFVATFCMIIAAVYLAYMRNSEDEPPKRALSTFPTEIGGWHGEVSYFDDAIYDALGVDDSILISYKGPENKEVQVYVGYYRSQREGDLIHSPRNCMPGSGWKITSTSTEHVPIDSGTIEVSKLMIEKGRSRLIALYWFQSRGRYINSEYWQKIYLVWDAIIKNRTDGSFVRLIAPVEDQNEASTTDYLKTFASSLIPILNQYLPSGD